MARVIQCEVLTAQRIKIEVTELTYPTSPSD
jgi:hypothetical protein